MIFVTYFTKSSSSSSSGSSSSSSSSSIAESFFCEGFQDFGEVFQNPSGMGTLVSLSTQNYPITRIQ